MLPLLASAQHGGYTKIVPRPLTPQEIKDYGLTGLVKSPGIHTVGVGDPVYLEVQVENGTTVTGGEVAWSIVESPGGSSATLEPSPLDPSMPIYSLAARSEATWVSRSFLQPDAVGQYKIRAEVPTDHGTIVLETYVTAALFVGVGVIDGATPTIPQCGVCHGEFSFDNQVDGWLTTAHHDALVDKLNNVGQPGDHFASYCLSCHTTGYNADPPADNLGFDDVAVDTGWTFPSGPASPGTTHWDEMPDELKQRSNIQCESCHGPGSEHSGATSMAEISVSLDAGDCAQCHDSEPYHTIVGQWEQSLHAVVYPGHGSSCARCHSGLGFIQYTDGDTVTGDYEAITCQVCHDPHSGENHHQIREVGPVTLANGDVVTEGGDGKLCMNCHQSRRDAETYAIKYNRRHNPHHGPQGDMLAGKNAYDYGMFMPSTRHITAVENSCVGCHMQEAEGDIDGIAGGHTWWMSAEVSGNIVQNVSACQSCHGEGVDSFNLVPADDYDGDGVLEGVQDEVHGLMAELAQYLDVPGEGANASVTRSSSLAEFKAAFNYNFVNEDKSFGVHNAAYTVAILKASIADITADDSDQDGMNDTLEIEYFGSTDATPGADYDKDGLTNEEELAQGTNPNEWDSDGDGISDYSEILVASNPMDPDETPDTAQKIYTAIEFLFYAETGKTYQIQSTTELASGVWNDVGDPVDGGDQFIQTFFSIIGKDKEFYRVVELD